MIVIASNFGTYLHQRSERLVVKDRAAKEENEYPFLDLEGLLVLNRGVTISSDLIFECQKRAINVTFVDKKTDAHITLNNNTLANDPDLIKRQVMASLSPGGCEHARLFISCKLKNQRAILKYFLKNDGGSLLPEKRAVMERSTRQIEDHLDSIGRLQSEDIEKFKKDLFLIEAHAAQRYFGAIAGIIPAAVGFSSRVQRSPYDEFNAALNYCYGILKSLVSNFLNKYGLVRYIGFLHSDAPERISLAFDVMEEFRQLTCDLPLISFFRGGGRVGLEECRITLASRRELASIFFSKLNGIFKYNGEETNIAEIIEDKIAEIRDAIKGIRQHTPFVLKW